MTSYIHSDYTSSIHGLYSGVSAAAHRSPEGTSLAWRRTYDEENAVFSPQGRLFQVDYASQSVSDSLSMIGIKAKNGIVLIKARNPPSLQLAEAAPRLQKLNGSIICGACGIQSDIDLVVQHARQEALRYRLVRQRDIPCTKLVQRVSELKRGHTAFRNLRPLGVGALFAGYTEDEGFKLMRTDPSGSFQSWEAVCLGRARSFITDLLEDRLARAADKPTWQEACKWAYESLRDASDTLSVEDVELAVLRTSATGGPEIEFFNSLDTEGLVIG